jgi:ComF family protein
MVHALKYGGWHALASPMGRRMAALTFPLETEEEVRFVVPVPLGPARLRARGYNQAECLAREVARCRGWSCRPDLLLRARATDAQATLHADERRANVAGAFRAADSARDVVQGEHLLVVDDVWTTGATALACCQALLSAGARAVSVLTFARALPDPRH